MFGPDGRQPVEAVGFATACGPSAKTGSSFQDGTATQDSWIQGTASGKASQADRARLQQEAFGRDGKPDTLTYARQLQDTRQAEPGASTRGLRQERLCEASSADCQA